MKSVVLIAGFLGVLFASSFAQDAAPDEQAVKVVEKWIGADSKVERADYRRIVDQEVWKKFWEEHAGKDSKVPGVDFDMNMVVACHWRMLDHIRMEFVEVRESREAVRLVFTLTGPQVMYDPNQKSHMTYVIAVVPKSKKAVEFVQRHHEDNLKDARIVETVRKTLAAP